MNRFEKKEAFAPTARAMRAAGASIPEIARRFELTEAQAGLWCKGVVCPVDHVSEARKRFAARKASEAAPIMALARRMKAEGKTFDEITASLRVSRPTAVKWCRGITPRLRVKGFEKLNEKLRLAGIPAPERQRVIDKARAEMESRP